MPSDRVMFQVYVYGDKRWRTVYVKFDMLAANMALLRGYGIRFRVA
jgi:hypothetical protein